MIADSIRSKVIASLIEVCGGQPFDAWKVYRQTKQPNMPPLGELWRASGVSSFHRIFFYMPSIYITDSYMQSNIDKVLFVPLIVTPHVAFFENLKTRRQLGLGNKLVIPCTFLSTYFRETFFITGMTIVVPELKKHDFGPMEASIIAATMSQVASQPFDTIKTIQEHKQIPFFDAFKGQTLLGLWRGVAPRVLRGIWSFYCMNFFVPTCHSRESSESI